MFEFIKNPRGFAQGVIGGLVKRGLGALGIQRTLEDVGLHIPLTEISEDVLGQRLQWSAVDQVLAYDPSLLIPDEYHVPKATNINTNYQYKFSWIQEDKLGNVTKEWGTINSDETLSQDQMEVVTSEWDDKYKPVGGSMETYPTLEAIWTRED